MRCPCCGAHETASLAFVRDGDASYSDDQWVIVHMTFPKAEPTEDDLHGVTQVPFGYIGSRQLANSGVARTGPNSTAVLRPRTGCWRRLLDGCDACDQRRASRNARVTPARRHARRRARSRTCRPARTTSCVAEPGTIATPWLRPDPAWTTADVSHREARAERQLRRRRHPAEVEPSNRGELDVSSASPLDCTAAPAVSVDLGLRHGFLDQLPSAGTCTSPSARPSPPRPLSPFDAPAPGGAGLPRRSRGPRGPRRARHVRGSIAASSTGPTPSPRCPRPSPTWRTASARSKVGVITRRSPVGSPRRRSAAPPPRRACGRAGGPRSRRSRRSCRRRR